MGQVLLIRQIRREKGMSANELARRAKISSASISCIERGEQDPRLSVAYRIADALDVLVDDFRAS